MITRRRMLAAVRAVEEFTDKAAGAVIKAGLAEAGVGVRAVAKALGLSFASLGRGDLLPCKPR